ncbi:MAG: carboxymuconolactone decarboxylase family protein [Lapillicoccus sp.]
MTETARIPLRDSGSLVTAMNWYTRRAYGAVMEPALAMAHNRKVLMTTMRNEMRVQKWDAADDTLKDLASLAAAGTVDCSWCMDFGYWVSHGKGLDPAKLEAVASWRTSDALSEVERRVVEYAEAMSTTPLTVTDAMVAALRELLSDAAIVEITAVVALENQRARFNTALGMASQGFKAQCDLRPARA